MKIIFLGAPGTGKGTHAGIVSKRMGIPVVSTGAMIREAIKNGTPLGEKARAFTSAGALVPDEVVIGIVRERLNAEDCRNGFILDGFPRTVAQAEALEKMGISIDKVICIEVPDDEIVKRMAGRRICPSCGAAYHVDDIPSAAGDRCEKCLTKLVPREDDRPEIVTQRLAVYHEQTEPIKDYYEKRGKCFRIDGRQAIEVTAARVQRAIEGSQAR